jgi:endonuclease YncB( thermonuclease family)
VNYRTLQGTFNVLSTNRDGQTVGLQPDGDSIHFKPANPDLLDKLKRRGPGVRLTADGSLNLRMEGIDALELHYAGARQPAPLPEQARDRLLALVGITVSQWGPDGVTARPPVPTDRRPGYILASELDIHGRPVAFVFSGASPHADGAVVQLGIEELDRSANAQLLRDGLVFPLFYDTLPAPLRLGLTQAARGAPRDQAGVWRFPPTAPTPAKSLEGIQTDAVLYPKLFRRLVDFFRDEPSGDLRDLPGWLGTKNEDDAVMVLSQGSNWTRLSEVLAIGDGRIALRFEPSELVFRSR